MNKYDEMTTSRLEGILKSVKDDASVNDYVHQHTGGNGCFAEYFNDFMVKTGQSFPEVMMRSNISRNYFYNIVNGDRNPGRDKILALSIAAGMDYKHINRALKIAKEGVLYAKDERDARIIIAVNSGITSITEINMILEGEGLELIK